MIVLMAGGAALAVLMREDRVGSEHLAPTQVCEGADQYDRAQSEPQSQGRLHSPGLGGQHVHGHLPREEDALFR